MQDKIEVGEFVRTKNGKFGKVITTNINYRDTIKYLIHWNDGKAFYISQIKAIKHSKNIKKLIDVGDIVEVLFKETTGATILIKIEDDEELKTLKNLHKKYIKSIVTKEQFDSIKYEVK